MNWLRALVGVAITGMWALSVLADMQRSAYEMSPFVHLAMMVVAGALFGTDLVRRDHKNRNGA